MSTIGHNKPFVSPHSLAPEEKKKLRGVMASLNDSMTRVASEREFQKEAINTISEELGLDKKLIRRMAKVYYKANFNEEVEQDKNFEDFYANVIKAPINDN
jgi:hypothetical protein